MDRNVVLVVDDDPLVRELLGEVLSEQGYEVVEATDGREAMELVNEYGNSQHRLCMIVLDMILPGADGMFVLQRMERAHFDIPVVAISASPEQLSAAARRGVSATVAKPFDPFQLVDTVSRHRLPRA